VLLEFREGQMAANITNTQIGAKQTTSANDTVYALLEKKIVAHCFRL
jgi:hypothetical protein